MDRLARRAVLHVDPERGWGGGETQVLGLTRYLHEAGHRSVAAVAPHGALRHHLSQAALPHCGLQVRNDFDALAGLRLRRLVRAGGYELVHFHTARAHALSPWLHGLGVKRVVTRRMDYPLKRTGWQRFLYRTSVDAVVAISHRVESALIDGGVPPARIRRIPSGIDTARFVPDPQARQRIRRHYGLGSAEILIVSIGALVERKAQASLIEAAAQLHRQGLRLSYMVCGDGPQRTLLEAQVRAAGLEAQVYFPGFCSDVPAYLAAADVFVHVPLWEGLGVAVIEALAAGRPVIASRVGGIPELIEDRHTGLLVPPQAPNALAAAVAQLVHSPALAASLGRAGQRRARTHFDVRAMAQANAVLYDELLTPRQRESMITT